MKAIIFASIFCVSVPEKILIKKVFDTSYFGFSGRKLLGATKSVGWVTRGQIQFS